MRRKAILVNTGATLSISPSHISLDWSGGNSAVVAVTSNRNWTVDVYNA